MKVAPQVKDIYRKLLRGMTKNVGESHIPEDGIPIHPEEIRSILVIRPNHRLGNQLLIIPVIEELHACFPNAQIDLFLKGNLGLILFKHFPMVGRIMRLPRKPLEEIPKYLKVWRHLKKVDYDVVVNVEKSSSSGRMATEKAKGRYKLFEIDEETVAQKDKTFQRDYAHNAKAPVLSLREHLAEIGLDRRQKDIPLMRLHLGTEDLKKGKEELLKISNPAKKTICLFTYATGDKLYGKTWWKSCYEKLKQNYPDCNIVELLPAEKVSQLDFKAPHYYSRDILEMSGFLNACDVFIGADSGVMHLACASGVPTLGLFKVTNPEQYGPYGHGSQAVDTNKTSIEELVKLTGKFL